MDSCFSCQLPIGILSRPAHMICCKCGRGISCYTCHDPYNSHLTPDCCNDCTVDCRVCGKSMGNRANLWVKVEKYRRAPLCWSCYDLRKKMKKIKMSF